MSRQRIAYALSAVGVVILSIANWGRFASSDNDPVLVGLATALILAAVVGGIVLSTRRDRVRRAAAASARPGWSTHAVWSDAALGAQLRRQGWHVERLRPSGGTRLTLAWSDDGIELWRGAEVLVPLSWEEVAAITPTTGQSGGAVRPAVNLSTTSDAHLVLVPTARPDGGILPASAAAVTRLVTTLRAARDLN